MNFPSSLFDDTINIFVENSLATSSMFLRISKGISSADVLSQLKHVRF